MMHFVRKKLQSQYQMQNDQLNKLRLNNAEKHIKNQSVALP